MADILTYRNLLTPNRWFLKTKKVFLENDQPVVYGLWGRFKRVLRLRSDARKNQNKMSHQAFLEALTAGFSKDISDTVGANLNLRLSQGKTLRLWDIKKQIDIADVFSSQNKTDNSAKFLTRPGKLGQSVQSLTSELVSESAPTNTHSDTASHASATDDNSALLSKENSDQQKLEKLSDHQSVDFSEFPHKSNLETNISLLEPEVLKTRSPESSEQTNWQETTHQKFLFGGGNFDASLAASGNIGEDLAQFTSVSDFHNLKEDKKIALQNIYDSWKAGIDNFHDNAQFAAKDLANLLKNCDALLQSVVCKPEFSQIYLDECGSLDNLLTSFFTASAVDNPDCSRIISDSAELMQKFTELSMRTGLMTRSTTEPTTIGNAMMFPAMLSALRFKQDPDFAGKLDSSGGAFLKKLLGTADEFAQHSKNETNPNDVCINHANFTDPLFRHIVNMEPLIFFLRAAGAEDFIDKTHAEQSGEVLVSDRQTDREFAQAVNAIVENNGMRQLNAQSDPLFYDLNNIEANKQMAGTSFTHCTGIAWDELNTEQKNRASQICQRMAYAAGDAGLKTEQYLSMMRGVVSKATFDDNYLRQFNNGIESVAQSMVDLTSTILVKDQQDMTRMSRAITEKLSMPLANLVHDTEPRPDLELLAAVASTQALLRLDVDLNKQLFGERLKNNNMLLPVTLQTSRLASRDEIVEKIQDNRLNMGHKQLAEMIDLAPLRMFVKHGLKSNLQEFARENHTAEDISEKRDWLKSGPMTDLELHSIQNSDNSRYDSLLNLQEGHIQAVIDGITSGSPPAPSLSRKRKPPRLSLPADPNQQSQPILSTLLEQSENIGSPTLQDTLTVPSRYESRLSLSTSTQNLRDISYNQLSATPFNKKTFYFPTLSVSASSENFAEPDNETAAMIAKLANMDSWAQLENDKRTAVSHCYNRFMAPLINNSWDREKVVKSYEKILKALLNDPAIWSQFSNKMDQLIEIFSRLGAIDDLQDAAQSLAKINEVMAEWDRDSTAVSKTGKFSPEIVVASAALELREKNPQILANFAKNMEDSDIFPQLFMASIRLNSEAFEKPNSDKAYMEVAAVFNDINYLKPLIDAAHEAHFAQTGQTGRCQNLINLSRSGQIAELKKTFDFLDNSSVETTKNILTNLLFKSRSEVYATS